MVLLGGGLAAVAVLLLAVFGYMQLTKKDPPKVIRNLRPLETQPEADKGKRPRTPTVAGNLGEITNLLPNDTEAVITCANVQDLRKSPVGKAAFSTPGAFRQETLAALLGVSPGKVEKVVVAENGKDDWFFAVIRTSDKISLDDLKKSLSLKPAEPIEKLDYFVGDVGAWLNNVTQMLDPDNNLAKPEPRPLAVRLVNDNTLVLADVTPMKAFLKAKGQPELRAKPGGSPMPEGGPNKEPPPSSNYLTVSPALKVLLDRMESRPSVLITVAADLASLKQQQRFEPICARYDLRSDADLEAIGLCYQQTPDESIFSLGSECKKQEFADNLPEKLRTRTRELLWRHIFHRIKVFYVGDEKTPIGPTGPNNKVIPPDKDLPKTTFRPEKKFRTVFLSVEFSPSQRAVPWLRGSLEPKMQRRRGLLEMASAQPQWQNLAAALRAYVDQPDSQKFLRGIYPRGDLPPERNGRPWPPDEHVSWMAALLPFLGEEYKGVRTWMVDTKSWRDLENLRAAPVLVPAFLAPGTPRDTWWVTPHSLPDNELANTQFVGIAGVGLDAAEYLPGDPDVAGKLGIFGYHRETKLADVARPATTIAIAQVPPTFKRPWIAGGGATIQGVPETKSVQPFVSGRHQDRPGTFVIMADGSVRFVPATIADAVFKAMCTLKGADPAQVEKETVLISGPPAKVVLKADPAPKK